MFFSYGRLPIRSCWVVNGKTCGLIHRCSFTVGLLTRDTIQTMRNHANAARSHWTLQRYALLAFVFCVACRSDRPDPSPKNQASTAPPAVTPATPAPPAAETGTQTDDSKPQRSLSRAELEQLLDAWLKAQDDGDFAAYEALYTPEMRGVKRVGDRETRMDRAQWMKDRARMFRRKMEVEAHSITFRSLMATAVIEFTQVFQSGKFMDSGTKRMMVTMHEGTPRIMYEEMLHSEIVGLTATFKDLAYVAFRIGDATYVVLQTKAEPSWGKGSFALEGTPETDTAYAQAVDVGAVPDAQSWLGTALRVYDDAGLGCRTNIAELKVLLVADEYTLDEEEEKRIQALSEQEATDARARAILRDEPAMLVGKLSTCAGVIAMPDTLPEPTFYLPLTNEPALEQAAIAETQALPKYKALQAEWEKRWRGLSDDSDPTDQPGDWGGKAAVHLFGAANGQRFAIVRYGNPGLEAEMPDLLLTLFRIDAGGALTLHRTASDSLHPTLLLDVNADGTPEILSHDALYGVGAYGLFLIQEVHRAYNGCSC